ncbi:MAG: amidohydrolase family protein [Bryobacteraceae bacterium]
MEVTQSKPILTAEGSSRRVFLATGLAATGIAALFPRLTSLAQSGNNPRRIDVHHHFTPPAYLEFTRMYNSTPGAGGGRGGAAAGRAGNAPAQPGRGTSAFAGWRLEEDMADMDKNGTATAILSLTTPGLWFGPQAAVRKVVRDSNEYAAKLMSDHPGRFGSFASIYPPDTDNALKEIEYSLDKLKADGIALYTNYRDKWLGHEFFNPVWEELNRRKAVVYVHPIEAACCVNPVADVTDTIIEYGADTTRTIASLIFSGSSTKYPDIKWIFSHGGGMMPYVIERFVNGTTVELVPGIVTKGQGNIPPAKVPGGVLKELQKMHYDTAQASNPVAMRALRTVVPVTQILFGTDYWYRTAEETGRGLTTNKVFTDAELKMIDRGNVERILPKYKG